MPRLASRLTALFIVAVAVPLGALACRKAPVERAVPADAAPPTPTALDSAACRDLYLQGEEAASIAWERAPKDCVTADDCVNGSKVGCYGGDCGAYPFAKRGLADYQAAHERLDATICRRFREGDCYGKIPIAIPSCGMNTVGCVKGQCVLSH